MVTILLTSSGNFVTEQGLQLLGKPLSALSLSYVTTAGKGVTDKSFMEVRRRRMHELGINYHEFDIEGKHEGDVQQELLGKDAVYMEGGNSFYLLKCIRESGFGSVVKKLLPQGLVYIGSSAGAYVACPTIEMATWQYQDKYDRHSITDLTGLGLVPFLVTVHYKPEYHAIIGEQARLAHYPVKVLTDEQALLIKDEQVHFLGLGPEAIP